MCSSSAAAASRAAAARASRRDTPTHRAGGHQARLDRRKIRRADLGCRAVGQVRRVGRLQGEEEDSRDKRDQAAAPMAPPPSKPPHARQPSTRRATRTPGAWRQVAPEFIPPPSQSLELRASSRFVTCLLSRPTQQSLTRSPTQQAAGSPHSLVNTMLVLPLPTLGAFDSSAAC